MPNTPHPKREQIISDLIAGIPPKAIAAARDVCYATVISHKDRFLESFYKLKKALPDPNQFTFKF